MNEYINKLKKAFDLILNDVPDNRDDTINAKLIDSLKLKLENCSDRNESELRDLMDYLKNYLNEEIIKSNCSYADSKLADKDFDIVKFFMDLIQVYLNVLNKQKSKYERELFSFKNKLLKYINSFFESNKHVEIESSECCSLFSLIELIYDISNELNFVNNVNDQFKAENDQILNEIILDTHLFGDESILIYLNPDYKSLFVRKSYKNILKKHLINLIQEISFSSNTSSIENARLRLNKICNQITNMNFEIKMNNYDLYVNIIRYFFFELSAFESYNNNLDTTRLLDTLKIFNSSLNFKLDKTKFLIEYSHMVNETSMESFSYLLAFDLVLTFIKVDTSNNSACVCDDYAQTPLLFYQTFLKQINNISNHFITAQLVESETSQNEKSLIQSLNISSKCKKSTDMLFKFHIYLYSFMNEMSVNDKPHLNATNPLLNQIYQLLSISNTHDPLVSIKTQINLLKYKICELLTVPFHLEFNKRSGTTCMLVDEEFTIEDDFKNTDTIFTYIKSKYNQISEETYLLLLQDKSFEYKQLIFKQSLVNLKIFIRKFLKTNNEFNLVRMISIKQIIYIQRHLDIDIKLKTALLDTLVDYFKIKLTNSSKLLNKFDSNYLNRLINSIMDNLELKLNESFNEQLFKLITYGLIDLNEYDLDEYNKSKTFKIINTKLNELLFKHLLEISNDGTAVHSRNKLAITLNCNNLNESYCYNHKYYDQFNIIVKFLINLLKESSSLLKPNGYEFEFVINLMNANEFYIWHKFNHVLFQNESSNSENSEIINELNDSIFVFMQYLYSSLTHKIKLSLNDKLFKTKQQELKTNIIYDHVTSSNEDYLNLSYYVFEEPMVNNSNFISTVEQMCLVETEAFLRREEIKFLCIYHSYMFKNMILFLNTNICLSYLTKFNLGNFNLKLWNAFNYFSYFLSNDFDWEIQIYCLEFFRDVFGVINLLLEKLDKLHNEIILNDDTDIKFKHTVSSKLIIEFSKYNIVEIIFCFSDCLKSLIGCMNDYDQQVTCMSAQLLLELKLNKKLIALIEESDAKHNTIFQEEIKSTYVNDMKMSLNEKNKKVVIGAEYSNCIMNSSAEEDLLKIEEENYLKKFLNSITIEYLNHKLEQSKKTSDLYSMNPVAIVDDIISSYQFDIDEEKAVDCY